MCIKFNCTHCGDFLNRTEITKKFRTNKKTNIQKLNKKLKIEGVMCANCNEKGGIVAIRSSHGKEWKGNGTQNNIVMTRPVMMR